MKLKRLAFTSLVGPGNVSQADKFCYLMSKSSQRALGRPESDSRFKKDYLS
jgi:hypothetical protein